jgi:hypothetical protein
MNAEAERLELRVWEYSNHPSTRFYPYYLQEKCCLLLDPGLPIDATFCLEELELDHLQCRG